MLAIEFKENKNTKSSATDITQQFYQECLYRNFIPGIPVINLIRMAPPLIINKRISDIAIDILDNLNQTFDLIFSDADKENYVKYFQLVSKKLNPNGIIISDNVLWSGKVVEGNNDDQETNTLIKFNRILKEDKKFETVILPLRDGISISRLV